MPLSSFSKAELFRLFSQLLLGISSLYLNVNFCLNYSINMFDVVEKHEIPSAKTGFLLAQ